MTMKMMTRRRCLVPAATTAIFMIMMTMMVAPLDSAMIETLPSTKATLETMTGPGRWYAIDFHDESLTCGDGTTPLSILFKRASSYSNNNDKKWLIEFEGGRTPTCFKNLNKDTTTAVDSCCDVTSNQLRPSWTSTGTTGSNSSSSSDSGFLFLDDIPVCHGWSQGLVEDDLQALLFHQSGTAVATATVDDNDLPIPLRKRNTAGGDWWSSSDSMMRLEDYNYVLVPDCTADLHLGMNPDGVQYVNGECGSPSNNSTTTDTASSSVEDTIKVYHRGGLNRRAVMEWIVKASEPVGGIDALVTVAGGRPLEGGRQWCLSEQSSFSSIAPVLATAQAATEIPSSGGGIVETLTIQDGIGLFLPPQDDIGGQLRRLPSRQEMETSWNIQDDELFFTTADSSSASDVQETTKKLIKDLVLSNDLKNGHPHTVVWTASTNVADQVSWLDPLLAQGLPVHVYQTQPTGGSASEPSTNCPRFAFPEPSISFAQFLTTQVAWNPISSSSSSSGTAAAVSSFSYSASASEDDDSGRQRLTFLSVVLIIVGVVGLIYIGYFALKHRRLSLGKAPPPSPVELWFTALTRYPGWFLFISLLIPIILSVTVFVEQDGQINVNLDFDSYLEINTPLENTRRVYEYKQHQQWKSRDIEEDHCTYLNSDSVANNPNNRRSLSDDHRHDVDVTLERLDINEAIDWDYVLSQIDGDDVHEGDEQRHQERKLDMANLLYASGGEVISIMYQNPKVRF
jgi:hypothetical protein